MSELSYLFCHSFYAHLGDSSAALRSALLLIDFKLTCHPFTKISVIIVATFTTANFIYNEILYGVHVGTYRSTDNKKGGDRKSVV